MPLPKMRLTYETYLLLLVPITLLVRFYNIEATALDGFDSWFYHYQAGLWNKGTLSPVETNAKFGFISLCAISSEIFANADYSLPVLNATLDTLNTLLLILLARLSSFSGPTALSCGFAYALLPAAILLSRDGLAHPASVFFLLLAMASFLHAKTQPPTRRLVFMGLCGFSCSYATTCHPTMLVFVPLLGVAVLARHVVFARSAYGALVSDTLLFSLGATIPYIYFAGFIPGDGSLPGKLRQLSDSILAHGNVPSAIDTSLHLSFEKVYIFFCRYILTELLQPLQVGLFLLSLTFLFIMKLRGQKRKTMSLDKRLLLHVFLLFTTFAIFSVRFNGNESMFWGARLFFSLTPFCLIIIYGTIENAAALVRNKRYKYAIYHTACVASIMTFFIYMPFYIYTAPPFYKYIKTVLKAHNLAIDNDHRILLVPSSFYPYSSIQYYVSGDYIKYLPPPTQSQGDESHIDNFIMENKISYIVVSRSIAVDEIKYSGNKDSRWTKNNEAISQRIWPEYQTIIKYITSKNIQPLFSSDGKETTPQSFQFFPIYAICNSALRAHVIDHVGRQNSFDIFTVANIP